VAALSLRAAQQWQRLLGLAERRLPALTRLRAKEPLPIGLHRRRIYVLPTRFGLIFSVMLFTMLLGALNYNNNAALLLTCLIGGTAFLSMFSGFRTLDGLALKAIHAAPCFAGEPLSLQLQFEGGTRQRRALRLDHPGGTRVFRLEPGADGRLGIDLPTERRGRYRLPRLRLWTEFPLGMFWVWSWLHPDFSAIVYPRREVRGPELPDFARVGGNAPQRRDGDEFASLRGYRPSDPPRLIAWKASARHDNLLVREHEQAPAREVVLDFDALDALPREARIARLAHWVCLAEVQRRPYRLLLPGLQLGPALGATHRHACLTELALL
jgi:uncharacterized protein (DUF58 family)